MSPVCRIEGMYNRVQYSCASFHLYVCLLQVAPWVVDVTDAALSSGSGGGLTARDSRQRLTISYQGLYRGHDPPPGVSGAYIMMESSLVLIPAADDHPTADA